MKRVVAWAMLFGSMIGDALSWANIIGRDEPKLVLHLSWFALIYAAIDGIMIQEQEKKREDEGR